MADHLQRVISEDGRFFGLASITTDLVAEACRRHDTGPVATVALVLRPKSLDLFSGS